MNWFSRLTVKAKLLLSFIAVALVAGVIGTVGFASINRVQGMNTEMHDYELMGLYTVGRADAELRSAGRALRSVLIAQQGSNRQQAIQDVSHHFEAVESLSREIEGYFRADEGRQLVQELFQSISQYRASVDRVLSALKSSAYDAEERARRIISEEARNHGNAAEELVGQILERKRANALEFKAQGDRLANQAEIAMAILALLGVILAVLLGAFLARGLSQQLGGEPDMVGSMANAIASGDLTVKINAKNVPPKSIMANMMSMQTSLQSLVGAVLSSSNSIASGASQISAGNTDLSQRTEEQAANLTQTASAMEELSSTVQNNAQVAQQAAQRALAASRSAENGGVVVNDVVQTMAGITESSNRIVDIIAVIDSIAFQTNILALNAAVEAARAGEQGRGFAVVASEVRSLAQKSASAAKDIKQLIDDNVHKIEEGSKLVDAAGQTMSGIVTEVKQVTDLISEISAATTEQTSGISQVNDAVLQLSDVTQQNAALVEQSAAAASSLDDQAQHLVSLVTKFKLDQSATAQPAILSPTQSPVSVISSREILENKRSGTTPKLQIGPGASKEADWEEF